MEQENQIWLVTTEHLEDRLWFRDNEDFKTGMNYVAVQTVAGNAMVLAFILMSNHVHFVLQGRYEDVASFINGFKMRYALYIRHKYGHAELLRQVRYRFSAGINQAARVTGLSYETAARLLDQI